MATTPATTTPATTTPTGATPTVAASTTPTAQPTLLGPYANPLNAYPDYTYNITLWMLSPSDYNALIADPAGWKATTGKTASGQSNSGVIASSGGKYSTTGQYSRLLPYFDLDFFIDDFELNTLAQQLGDDGSATNDGGGGFTIIEPIGMTFVDRWTLAAFDISGGASQYETPLMIEIDFFGAGTNYVSSATDLANGQMKKRFPIKVSEMKMNFTNSGTEYKIKFVPWAWAVAPLGDAIIPTIKVENVTTVGSFFGGQNTADSAYLNAARSDPTSGQNSLSYQITQAAVTQTEQSVGPTPPVSTVAKNLVNSSSAVAGGSTGLAYAVNLYNYNLVFDPSKGAARSYPDFIEFDIHPSISNSTIVNPGSTSLAAMPMLAGDPNPMDNQKVVLNAKGGTYNIPASTSIPALIGQVLRNSKYIQDQLTSPKDTAAKQAQITGTPLQWYKITTSRKLVQWDAKAGNYATITTYHVMPYTVYHTNHPLAAQTVPTGNPYKKYAYYYTGENTDVIDCTFEFDTAFYTEVSLGNDNNKLTPGAKTSNQLASDNSTTTKSGGQMAGYPNLNGYMDPTSGIYVPVPTVNPRKVAPVISNQQANTGLGSARDEKTQIAASLKTTLTDTAAGTNLVLSMKIIGDPHYIKQDDILWNPSSKGYVSPNARPDQAIITTGSLPFDGGFIYIDISFYSPTDINVVNGLVAPSLQSGNQYVPTSFSGRYIVTEITNKLAKGVFEQELKLVRQADAEKSASAANAVNTTRTTTAAATVTPAPTAVTASSSQSSPISPVAMLKKTVSNLQGITKG